MPTIDLVAEAYELQIDSAATGGISKLHFGSESERFSRLEKERNDFLLKRTPFSYALSTNRTIGDTLAFPRRAEDCEQLATGRLQNAEGNQRCLRIHIMITGFLCLAAARLPTS